MVRQGRNNLIVLWTLSLFLLLGQYISAQETDAMSTHRYHEMKSFNDFVARSMDYSGDTNIDIKFYYLDIEIGIESPYINGNVWCRFEVISDQLNAIELDLNSALTVDSITGSSTAYSQNDDKILIQLDDNYINGDLVDIHIYYQGIPVEAGGYKGLRYEAHHGDQPIIATLSTPYLAHYWYPCKDGPGDKPDSVYVDITIEKQTFNGIELIGVSNGILENTIDHGDRKTFQWRHRYPIVTYYVMAAISNYVQFSQDYSGSMGENFPIDYYVFREDSAKQHQDMESFPEVMDYFSEIFGPYPFANEKYGMSQLGYYGAIENQTNTIINSMTVGWFRVAVHELAHMWFADAITCNNWHHGWLNEGFASYSESLWKEKQYGDSAYHQHMASMAYFDEGTLYLENAADTFHVFTQIIYDKGGYLLHMLRGVTGDSLFFESVKNYATDSSLVYQHAVTEDLQDVFETTCSMDLDYFFEQWVYDEYYPIYHYNYSHDSDNFLRIIIEQTQGQMGRRPVFSMPIQLQIQFADGSDTTLSVWNDTQQQYFEIEIEKNIDSLALDPEKWILREAYLNPTLEVGHAEYSSEMGIEVYPNPFWEQLYISFKKIQGQPFVIDVFNSDGKLLHSEHIEANSLFTINMEDLAPGLYIYSLRNKDNQTISSGKLIKK